MLKLLQAALKTGAGTVATILLSVVSGKILAVVLGPAGVGLFSNLAQVLQTCTLFATIGGPTAIVQGLASRDPEAHRAYLAMVRRTIAIGFAGTCAVLLAGAPWIAGWLAASRDPTTVRLVWLLVAPLAAGVLLTFLQGVLNGYKAIGRLAIVSVTTSAVGAALAFPLASMARTHTSALVALLAIPNASAALLAWWFAKKEGWLGQPVPNAGRDDHGPESATASASARSPDWRPFLKLALATLAVAQVAALSIVALRGVLVHHGGLALAGVFSVAWTISTAYAMVALSAFSSYFLPTLSGARELDERSELLNRVSRLTVLVLVPAVIAVIVAKPLLVRLLYSAEFLPALDLLRWFLVADFFRVAAWVLAMPLVAFARSRALFWSEFTRAAVFLFIGGFSILAYGRVEGVGIGAVFTQVASLGFFAWYIRQVFKLAPSRRVVSLWLGGLLLVLACSASTWSAKSFAWLPALAWIGAALGYCAVTLDAWERQQALLLIRRWRSGRSR